ncbi:MAG: type I-E CRISPR-associated protein Cas7/Cse4/CasC [Desulfobacteraceae bacterium]|jgi:CRISPR system Cascade subunit CasC
MSRFIQLHVLTSYPPANLNRDDQGRPKTAKMGGTDRLRVSSQSLKRSWRTSDLFQSALAEHIGTRTKRAGLEVRDKLVELGVDGKKAKAWAQTIAKEFGKLKKASKNNPDEDLGIEQLTHFSPEEWRSIMSLSETLANENRPPNDEELTLLRKDHQAVDIAFFGRMLADKPIYNMEAAVQVAHAISTHTVVIEDDYFTAVDDLNRGDVDSGAGHVGDAGFAAGLFYLYTCINLKQLIDNLGGNMELAKKAVGAFVEVMAKVGPGGKQNSFASRAYSSYMLAERGNQQPRSLSVAFLKPVNGTDLLNSSIEALELQRTKMYAAYGPCAEAVKVMNVEKSEGTLQEIIDFCKE